MLVQGTILEAATMGDTCKVSWHLTGITGTYGTGFEGQFRLAVYENAKVEVSFIYTYYMYIYYIYMLNILYIDIYYLYIYYIIYVCLIYMYIIYILCVCLYPLSPSRHSSIAPFGLVIPPPSCSLIAFRQT